VTYYRLLQPAAPATFDADEAARLELDWWQARREKVGSKDYGRTVAEVASLTYGKSKGDPAMLESGVMRAEAMAYRDARAGAMTEAHWDDIEMQLLRAYRLLKASVTTDH
jgi:hypothetical protein